jgi:hypothetical protein
MTYGAIREVTGKELAEMLFKSMDNKPTNIYEIIDSFNIDINITPTDDNKCRGKIKKISQWKFSFTIQDHFKSDFLILTLLGATIRELGFIQKPDYWNDLKPGHVLKLNKLDGVQLGQAERFAQTLLKLMAE